MKDKLNMKDKLIKKITSANHAFSKGRPYLTDEEYDRLWKELYDIAPDSSCLYHTTNDPSLPYDVFPHSQPIHGTNKAFNTIDLHPFMQRFGSHQLVLEPKYDGCAAVFYAGKDPSKDRLILEGDGISGREITHHIEKIFFPQHMKAFESVEIIIPKVNWKEEYGSNPRNTVAGWLVREELPEKYIVDAVCHNNSTLNKHYFFNGNYEELEELLLQCHAEWSQVYPIDGIMIKVKDKALRLIAGDNNNTYAWSIAWKPPIQTKETIVTNIEWNVSRTGRIIPTIIYEPIKLCGTVNSRVTGNNAQWLTLKQIKIGSTIVVGKAGEIIPKIIEVKNKKTISMYLTPSHCPACSNQLQWVYKDLMCYGKDCIVQHIKKIAYFYSDKGMDLKTIGEFMVGDLLEDTELLSLLRKSPWALLDPIEYKIYDNLISIWGKKRTLNYMNSLGEINGRKNAIHFIAALAYPGLAYKTALKLYHFIKTGKIQSNIPKKARINFIDAFTQFKKAEEIFNNFHFGLIPPVAKITYCITGTLTSSRNDMITYLERYGWLFSNQVSKYTDYLIVGEKPGQTKTIKASELNILQINELDLPNYLKKGDDHG